jgi:hypothetical protein
MVGAAACLQYSFMSQLHNSIILNIPEKVSKVARDDAADLTVHIGLYVVKEGITEAKKTVAIFLL